MVKRPLGTKLQPYRLATLGQSRKRAGWWRARAGRQVRWALLERSHSAESGHCDGGYVWLGFGVENLLVRL